MIENQEDFVSLRARMVKEQIEARGIHDAAILSAMRHVPRELFVAETHQIYAYDDTPLPIPNQQTISQPYVVALMIRALNLSSEDLVLEIGTGSGYAAALLGQIAAQVHTIERHKKLVAYASRRLTLLGCDNVFVHFGDGTLGWSENAPYDAIIVAAGGPVIPVSLQQQLKIGGRLVMPVGKTERKQHLICMTRQGDEKYERVDLGAVAFVPLIGKEGW